MVGKALALRPAMGALLALLLLVLASAAVAARQQGEGPRRKFRQGDEITIAAGETVPHDLYVAAETLIVAGRVEGDLLVLAREVEIDGVVTGDLAGVASRVTIRGTVDGDVRALGARVTVEGRVGEDLLAGARRLDLEREGRVGGDLIYWSARSDLDGMVEGGILTTTGERVPDSGAGALLARDGGALPAPGPALQEESGDRDVGGGYVTQVLLRYLTVLIAGAVLLIVGRRSTWGAAEVLRRRPLPSLGAGVITMFIIVLGLAGFLIAVYDLFVTRGGVGGALIVIVMAFFALVGGSILLFVLLMAAVFFGQAVAGLAAGRLILQRVHFRGRMVAALFVGALVVAILTELPAIGFLLTVAATVFGIGALLLSIRTGEADTPAPVPFTPSPTA
jgi:cytoskeletal protein CcmA (bactofilin family)